jgi:hypothetical protein
MERRTRERERDRAVDFVRDRKRRQTSSLTPYQSNSAASDASLAPFGLCIIRAMLPSAANGERAETSGLWSLPDGDVRELDFRNRDEEKLADTSV